MLRDFFISAFVFEVFGNNEYYLEILKKNILEKIKNDKLTLSDIEALIDFLNKWHSRLKNKDSTVIKDDLIIVTSSVKDDLLKVLTSQIIKEKLGVLKKYSISNVDFSDKNIIAAINTIYSDIDSVKYIASTITSKILAVLLPDLFVMWDKAIRDYYFNKKENYEYKSEDYIEFLKIMQNRAFILNSDYNVYNPEKEKDELNVYLSKKVGYANNILSLAKFIDQYNWIKITKKENTDLIFY